MWGVVKKLDFLIFIFKEKKLQGEKSADWLDECWKKNDDHVLKFTSPQSRQWELGWMVKPRG